MKPRSWGEAPVPEAPALQGSRPHQPPLCPSSPEGHKPLDLHVAFSFLALEDGILGGSPVHRGPLGVGTSLVDDGVLLGGS